MTDNIVHKLGNHFTTCYPSIESVQYEVTLGFEKEIPKEEADESAEYYIKQYLNNNEGSTVDDAIKYLTNSSKSVEEGVFDEYLLTLKTKLAQYQSKKTLTRKVRSKNGSLTTSELIIYLLNQRSNNVYIKKQGKETEYWIGTHSTELFKLNKTSFLFAEYLVKHRICSQRTQVIDFFRQDSERRIVGSTWKDQVKQVSLTDVLVSLQGFGDYESLLSYIKGYQEDPSAYEVIHIVYNKTAKKVEVYDITSYRLKGIERKTNYVMIGDLTVMLNRVFKFKEVGSLSREEVLSEIETEFSYLTNTITDSI